MKKTFTTYSTALETFLHIECDTHSDGTHYAICFAGNPDKNDIRHIIAGYAYIPAPEKELYLYHDVIIKALNDIQYNAIAHNTPAFGVEYARAFITGEISTTDDNGIYTHDSGEIVIEKSFRIEIFSPSESGLNDLITALKGALNQESIIQESTIVTSQFI